MPHELNKLRLDHLSAFNGTIGIEEVGEKDAVEIVIRIPMFRDLAAETYYKLGAM